jgi:transposase InsO family protein
MKLHANAALSLNKRRQLAQRVVERRWTLTEAAAAAEVSVRCARKWVGRYRAEGELGLFDRSSAPRRVANRTAEERVEAIAALRRLRFTGAEIAELVGMALSTVSGILTRIGMGKLGRLGLEPARRYERERPGELVHVDVKKLGRIEGGAGKRWRDGIRYHFNPSYTDVAGRVRKTVGWEFVHIAIDDTSRVAYAQVLPDEQGDSASAFLRAAVAYYAALGVVIRAVLTDNGSCYRSREFAQTCRDLGLRHHFTRPYTPRTNGKAERFVQTALREWAYARAYARSSHRIAELPRWLHGYNWHRPHASLASQPPMSKLGLTRNNLVRLHN